ncbi:zinc ribbon domain-containing protein [Chloroflexota bacterium]
MPIYEFICKECSNKAEILLRSVNSEVAPTCPHCSSNDMERILSRFAYHQSEQMRRDAAGSSIRDAVTSGIGDPRDIGRSTEDSLNSMGIDIRNGENADRFASVRNMIDKARDGDMSILDKTGE